KGSWMKTTDHFRSLVNCAQSHSALEEAFGSVSRSSKACAVIGNCYQQVVVAQGKFDFNLRGICILGNVVQTFLNDSIYMKLNRQHDFRQTVCVLESKVCASAFAYALQ